MHGTKSAGFFSEVMKLKGNRDACVKSGLEISGPEIWWMKKYHQSKYPAKLLTKTYGTSRFDLLLFDEIGWLLAVVSSFPWKYYFPV